MSSEPGTKRHNMFTPMPVTSCGRAELYMDVRISRNARGQVKAAEAYAATVALWTHVPHKPQWGG